MFPTLSEAINGERLTVGPPFFNKWMTPVGLILLFLTGCRAAARVAQVDGREHAAAVPVAGARGDRHRRGRHRARDSVLGLGALLLAVRVRRRRDRAGVRARRGGAPALDGHGSVHRAGRALRAIAAALRGLHRPHRHRADLPRLCRRRLRPLRAVQGQAGRRDFDVAVRREVPRASASPTTSASRR